MSDQPTEGSAPVRSLYIRGHRADGTHETFTARFTVGRGVDCDIRIDSPLASRTHAECAPDHGSWWIKDLGSTNGLFIDGARVESAEIAASCMVQIGKDGPKLQVALGPPLQGAQPVTPTAHTPHPAAPAAGEGAPPGSGVPTQHRQEGSTRPTPPAAGKDPDDPLAQVIERYFDDDPDRPAGEHTRLIRRAYQTVNKRQSVKWKRMLAGLGVLLLVALAFGGVQRMQNQQLRGQAEEIFSSLKELDVTIMNLRRLVEAQGGAELTEQLTRLDAQRARLNAQYEGYIQDMGVYRKLKSDEERLIYQTARAFGESETSMSRDFVERVKEEIEGYWQKDGSRRYERAIRRAEDSEYTPFIVQTLREHGLPPEFYYLALQESDFIPDRVGPETRWGHAKGAWQFIPTTARRYGLNPGPRADSNAKDPLDERQNFFLATDAAARYLLDLHGVLTQASGLLVMASYNWGEHRVLPRLNDLPTPDAVFDATFEDVPSDPQSRNYWKFLSEYESRMPDETKDYVLKIFSAAVIGKNPRYFGFDFDDPLAPYVR